MIKNIIFDLGGILVGLDSARSIAAFEAIGAIEISKYIKGHRTEDLFLDIEIGRKQTSDFCNDVRSIAHTEADDNSIIDAWNALLTSIEPQKLDIVEHLSHNYRLFLLSNTNDMHWQRCQQLSVESTGRQLSSYFEHCFLSYEMRMKKPSCEIFAEVLQKANLKASETLFIDDTLENCSAASAMGIMAFHSTVSNPWTSFLSKKFDL